MELNNITRPVIPLEREIKVTFINYLIQRWAAGLLSSCRMDFQWHSALPTKAGSSSLLHGGIGVKRVGVKFHISCQAQSEKLIVSITGATGFIGRKLVHRLAADGHEVRVVTRSISKAADLFPAKEYPTVEISLEGDLDKCILGSTGVVNLTGTPISTRWTSEVKEEIKQSRVGVTSKIVKAINSAPEESRPKVFVSASAVGYYGPSETSTYDETSPAGNDYLAQVCREWEAAASKVDGSVKLVLVRIGVVLDKEGGALAKMVPLFKVFAGGPLGSGKQWFSWVHRDDLVSLIVEALTNPSYQGVINGTAPNPVRMAEICETLGNVLERPSWLPVPELAIRAVLGEGAAAVVDGQRVLPKKAQELGFKFKYRYIGDALKAIFAS